jgi:eukaryotic-like serine/threonine-protein kinase
MGQPRTEEVRATIPPTDASVRAYIFDRFRVDFMTYELHRDDELVTISPRAFDVLLMLIRNRERAVSKDELMDFVWRESNVSEDSLTQCISQLRRALGDDPNHAKFITTVLRRGYRFISAVTAVPATVPNLAEGPATVDPPAPVLVGPSSAGPGGISWRIPWSRSAWMIGGAAIGLLLVVGIVARLAGSRAAAPDTEGLAALGKLRFALEAPDGTAFSSGGVLSPNGRYLAFAGEDDRSGSIRLRVKSLDTSEVHELAGSEGASRPFWSPDSHRSTLWLVFGSGFRRRGNSGNRARPDHAGGRPPLAPVPPRR